MTAYYNEFDPNAAAWLRELIAKGLIAPGDVDTRSIVDVRPEDLTGYVQCHFFAGIGVWSHALRGAGWSDDRPVWTGSCPCQPFSAAGKGGGFDDARHLWPDFYRLIRECRPDVVFGEQVASKDGLGWLDLVHADLEGTGYSVGAVDTCAAGFGAPHIRQRLWWVGERLADAGCSRRERRENSSGPVQADPGQRVKSAVHHQPCGCAVGMAHPLDTVGRSDVSAGHDTAGADAGRPQDSGDAGAGRGLCGVADADGRDTGAEREQRGGEQRQQPQDGFVGHGADRPGPTNGIWGAADWLHCRDGRWRPVEPGTFPLAHGAAARVGRLRGYGNAIVAPAAEGFIAAVMEAVS